MLEQKELCEWLRNNSSGIYRPASEAADEIERLQKAWDLSFKQAMCNGQKYQEAIIALENMADSIEQLIGRPNDLETKERLGQVKDLLAEFYST